MAVVKSILIALCALAGVGALVVGILGGLSLPAGGPLPPVTIAEVSLRPFPTLSVTAPQPAPSLTDDGGVATGTPQAVVDAGVAAPKPVVADAGAPRPAAPDAGAPAPRPAPGSSDAGVRAPPPPPAAPVGEGVLNLRASDTADVFVDGKKVGGSPIEGLKVRAGTHKVRFDCYDAAGNTIPGTAQSVTVAADAEATVDFTCSPE